MRTMALLTGLLAACRAEADPSLLLGHGGYAAPDIRYAYGRPVTAYNAAPYGSLAGYGYGAGYAAAAPIGYAAAAPVVAAAAAPIGYAAAAPVVAAAAPAPVVSGPVSSQYQSQDELGNIAYGYTNINSAKHEQGSAGGAVTGSYSYNDEAGTHIVSYVADDFGFRLVAPTTNAGPVIDTPEVAGAKAAFFSAYDAAAAHHLYRRSAEILLPTAAIAAAPGAPSREAILTRIQLNPGHADFYRVD